MRFSLYTEMQLHEGKSPEQLYAEVLEQIENADRLGYDCYAAIEHFFFPKFSVSAHPIALFAAAAQRTRRINFRTLLHALPYHNPVVLASEIAVTDILTGGRYEFGRRTRPRLDPREGGRAARRARAAERYEESVDLLFTALGNERFSLQGRVLRGRRLARRPVRRDGASGSSSAARPTARTSSPRSTAAASSCPPLLPYKALEEQLDLYRAKCAEHGNEPDIVWIHACYLDEDRDTAMREARDWVSRVPLRERSPLLEHEKPDAEALGKAGYGFYPSGSWSSSPRPRTSSCRGGHRLGRHARRRVERIEEYAAGLRRHLTEIAITVNAGGARLTGGDQEPGALRVRGDAARPR